METILRVLVSLLLKVPMNLQAGGGWIWQGLGSKV